MCKLPKNITLPYGGQVSNIRTFVSVSEVLEIALYREKRFGYFE